MKYYHGGNVPGRYVLPPSRTGAKSCAQYGADWVCRTDRVYITTDIESAIAFAYLSGGKVYEVVPMGAIEHDPDCNVPGLSYQCREAMVVREVKQAGAVQP